MKVHVLLAVLLTLGAIGLHAASAESSRAELLGDWRGTSKCVNLQAAPACQDETVLYHFLPVAGATDKVWLKADKLVNGVFELMGEFECHFNSAAGTWDSEIRTPRVHILWSYTVKDRQLSGTLVALPDRTLLRKVATTKVDAKP